MPLTNTQYASIMRLYDDIKTANRRMQSDRYNEVTALCPNIADIDSEIIDLSMKTARARIEADSSDTDTDELASSLKSLNERKVAALASIGKPLIILMIYLHVLTARIPVMSTVSAAYVLIRRLLTLYIRTLISRI